MGKIVITHTPGPWKTGFYRSDGKEQLAVWAESIKEGEKGHPVCLVSPVEKMDERDEANARLIAAAPELIRSLRTCVEFIGDGMGSWSFVLAAKAAIAKVEGTPVPSAANSDKRMAFFVMETQMNGKGEYNALIAVEGEQGYYKTDWYWGKDFKVAQDIADERNARLGLSKKEAAMVVCSTMRGMKMPEADDIDEPDDAALERHAGVDKPEVWTRFDITTLHPASEGKEVEIVMRTNDDDDDGVAGEITEWRKITTMQIALALSGGKSHMGGYGQQVLVTLDGKQI